MNRFFVAVATLLVICANAYATDSINNHSENEASGHEQTCVDEGMNGHESNEPSNSEQTCHFSLQYTTVSIYSRGSGFDCSYYVSADVIVNCTQEVDVWVTVSAYFNGKHIGSGTVGVYQGRLSGHEDIRVDPTWVEGWNGKGMATLKLE